MASSSSTYMSTSATFKMPLEPAPVPSIINRSSSDEESFVILGKSLADFDESAISVDKFSEVDSLGTNIIQEAQQLISQELAQMEKHAQTTLTADTEMSGAVLQQVDEINLNDAVQSERKNELPEMPPAEKSMVNSPQDGNKLISIVSFSPSEIVSEELQQKISQLIDENIHLKDTILQNNVSMKAQYERIVAWQEDVQKVHETHKEKFLQAKQYIEALKKENYNLKEEVEKLSDALINVKTENVEQKQYLMESSAINIKEFELEAINKKLKEELDAANKILKENQTTEVFEEKLLKYEKELEDAYKKIRGLEVEVQKRKSVAEVDLEQTVTHMKNMELNKDKESWELENKLKASAQTVSQFELKMDDYKHQMSTLKGIIEAKNATLLETHTKYKDLEQKLEEVSGYRHQLEIHIKSLKGELEEAKIEAWRSKSKETEKEKSYQEQIQMLRASLTSCNTYQQASAPSHEIENLRQQLMQSQIALTNCEQNRAAAYAQIEEHKRQIEDLGRQLEEAQTQGHEVFVWKTQVETYKADFEAERASKEAMRIERDKLSEDLQHLHRRNQQLQEEIEIVRPPVHVETLPRRSRGHNSSSSGESTWSNQSPTLISRYSCPICDVKFRSLRMVQDHIDTVHQWYETAKQATPKDFVYKCPKCNFGFHTLNACENHVMKCIELENSLP